MYGMPYSVLEFRNAGHQIVFNTQKKNKQFSLLIVNKNGVKNQKDYTVGIVPRFNWMIKETDKIHYPNTQIPNRSLSWLGLKTSIKCGGDKLLLMAQDSQCSLWNQSHMISLYH